MKDLIIGISLLWLLPLSILITRIIIYNLKIGILRDIPIKERKKKKNV